MIAKGVVNEIEITAGAINFDFIGGSCGAAESEAIMREAKVKEMREAIEEGRFPLDARKIAENFAELEKLL